MTEPGDLTKGALVPGIHWGRLRHSLVTLPGSANLFGQQLLNHKLFLERLVGTLF